MSVRHTVRHSVRTVVPAVLLAAVALTTAACASTSAGTPTAAAGTVAPTSTAAPVSPSAPVEPTTEAPAEPTTEAPVEPTTEEPTEPTEEPTEPTEEPTEPTEEPSEPTEEPTPPAHPSEFDQVTGVWLDTMCSDVHVFLGTVLAVPEDQIADGAAAYKEAWLGYFGAVTYQLESMVGNMSALDAPTLPNGPEVAQGYVTYFDNLKQTTVQGWELIDAVGTDDPQAVAEVVEQATVMMQQGTSPDMGMGDLVGPEYKAAMEQIDSCQPLLQG